jgi:drug/metabolite transporter (DMT)-like permease
MESKTKIDATSWVIMLFLSIIWGFSFILIKKALVAFAPVQVAGLRVFISAVAFLPFVWIHRKSIDWSRWKKFLAIGLAGNGIPAFLFPFAETQISSAMAGLLNSLSPIWTLIIGIILFRLRFKAAKIAGILIGFLGAALLILFGDSGGLGNNMIYGLFIVLATFCYGLSANLVQAYMHDVKPIIIGSVSFFTIGLPALVFLLATDITGVIATHPDAWFSLGAASILALFGTVLSTVLFYRLILRTNAVFGSTVTYLMPVFALLWGYIDGEHIGIIHFFGLLLILSGVYFTKSE